MSQKNFQVIMTDHLLTTSVSEESVKVNNNTDIDYRPDNLIYLSGKHTLVKENEGKVRRCQLKGCGKPTYYMCKKCDKHMHFKCFNDYHK